MKANELREYRGYTIEKKYSRFAGKYRFFICENYSSRVVAYLNELHAKSEWAEMNRYARVCDGLKEARTHIDRIIALDDILSSAA